MYLLSTQVNKTYIRVEADEVTYPLHIIMRFNLEKKIINKIIKPTLEAIRDMEAGEGKVSELEIMQAVDFVGFNLFRDNWEEYKKMDMMNRDQPHPTNLKEKDKRLLN